MNRTLLEQETVIVYNREEETATVWTADKNMANRMDKLAQKSKAVALIKSTSATWEYSIPKKCIKVHLPKVYSEEKRKEMALRAKERFGGSKNE